MKNVIILKSISGAGKSSFAELITEPKVIVCADFFFEKNGKYEFDATKLGQAHASCRKAFDAALINPVIENIVVANTNCKESDYAYYVTEAKKVGARITYVVLEKRHNNPSIHFVPEEVLYRQHTNLVNNLKLK
jgi:hypothetical protein